MNTEALIVGAGPVGLTMAIELARYGVSVRIVDKAPRRAEQSRALVVWSRTLELLDRAGCGAALAAAGFEVTAANILAGGKSIGRIDLGGDDTAHPYALMLPQCETERLLEAHLNGLGVQVERSIELTTFVIGTDRVDTSLRKIDGSVDKVQSLWIIGCDGAQSKVRDCLRRVFIGDAQPTRWILADVRITGEREPGEIDVAWHADGMLAILPITRERCRVMADVGPSQSAKGAANPTLDEVQALLEKRGRRGLTASQPDWLAAFHVNERKVANYRASRVFLAGDAAHVHNPAGAQGMNLGMQDAINLAWKLALVHHRICADEPLLGSYNSERSAVAERVLKGVVSKANPLAMLRGEVKQSIRNHIAALLIGAAPARNSPADVVTEITYPDSPLNLPGPQFRTGPAAGRAPVRTGESPFGAGDRPKFALCADASSCEQAAALAEIYKDLLEAEVRAPFAEGGLWLVRPDGYVAVSVNRDEWDTITAYLDQIHRGRRLILRALEQPSWMAAEKKQ